MCRAEAFELGKTLLLYYTDMWHIRRWNQLDYQGVCVCEHLMLFCALCEVNASKVPTSPPCNIIKDYASSHPLPNSIFFLCSSCDVSSA